MMRPWSIRSRATDRIRLTFTPEYERIAKADSPAYASEVHQVFGRYDGRIVPDGLEPVEIRGLFGWIEDHRARW